MKTAVSIFKNHGIIFSKKALLSKYDESGDTLHNILLIVNIYLYLSIYLYTYIYIYIYIYITKMSECNLNSNVLKSKTCDSINKEKFYSLTYK